MSTKRNRFFRWMAVWVSVGMMAACSQEKAPAAPEKEDIELSVFAAASLKDAVTEIQETYKQNQPEVRLVPHFASSGKLQRQIEQGASADLFLSAGKKEMNALLEKDHIDPDHHIDLLENQLTLIVPKQNGNKWTSMEDLTEAERISIGQPDTVPAGSYAKQALEDLGLWEELHSRIVFSGDVRQVLTYVETNNVDAGLVYRTDAQHSNKVTVAATVDPDSHQPIRYPVGVLKASKHPEEARKLYEWLQGEKARAIFEKYGFDAQ
ncbi:molybdate ABC transporter substrate-binding protein [Desmospora profundinema]|uniref:Molybdate transport system substrate-binding protein n=1 Tax=Desmospora profundinema TaxID=1571184 RepID=A0ABU1IKC6_9BACL|nr:molybdate ABC transporter substrate-binding protein [Desmospora profundinema]MDR6224429.1 molybdate transport system substrate-binding protein [Desmospora profundinema]